MPVKKRRSKGRAFDDYHIEQLIEGPDACLLAGVGYLTAAQWDQMDGEAQAVAMQQMQDDWALHGPMLMDWWRQGANAPPIATLPWVYPVAGGADGLPWAAEQFGEPPCR